jgi:hypothetical protein
MSTETLTTETTIAAFSHAVTMQTRELRLKSRAVKAGNFGNAGHHATEASKWAMTAWSLAGNLDRFLVAKLASAAKAAA